MTDAKPNPMPNPKTVKPGKRRPRTAKALPASPPALPASATKLDRLAALLARPGGASIAGALKRRGLTIASKKIDSVRRYRAGGR